MAEELVTPVDELSGLPLPIAPPEELLDPRIHSVDLHHHFHPRKSPLLIGDAGLAVRTVRLQRVDYRAHHNGYHGVFVGPPLPESDEQRFLTVIMAAAGYIPNFGLSFESDSVSLVRLAPDIKKRLQSSGELQIGSTAVVSKFIRQYIFGVDILKNESGAVVQEKVHELNIKDKAIEEFVNTTDPDRRRILGFTILELATVRAVEPLEPRYRLAWKKRAIHPGLPADARRFTKQQLGSREVRERIVDNLRRDLAA